jgi:hypothetical protein
MILKAVPDYESSDAALKAARLASLRVSAPSARGGAATTRPEGFIRTA